MAATPPAERPKRSYKLVEDYFADIGIKGNDQQLARNDTSEFLHRYIEEKRITRAEGLHYRVAAEAYLDELPTKFTVAAYSALPAWYMCLCTAETRDRQLAMDSIKGVLVMQYRAVGTHHQRFKNSRNNGLLEEATTASDGYSNGGHTRQNTPAINSSQGTKRGRKPTKIVLRHNMNQSRLSAGSLDTSSRDVTAPAPRMVRDLLDHNVRGLRETPEELNEDSEDDMVVLHPKKRIAREPPASSDGNVNSQIGDSVIVTSDERHTYEIPHSPELGPASLVRVAVESTTRPPSPWIDPSSREQPAFRTMANKEVNEASPGLDHHDVDPYRQPVVLPSPASSRTDGPSVLRHALENAIEIAELRAQLEQGQQRGYSEQRQTVEAAVPTTTLRKILSLVKEQDS